MSGGITSSRLPPTRIPTRPWSQPGMTMPAPSWKLNGCLPRDQDESNSWPVLHETPTYWTVSLSPLAATLPLPCTTSRVWRPVGGGPFGFGMTGLTLRSDDSAGSVSPPTLEPPPPGWLLLLLLELLPPQPPAAIAATATSAVGLPIRIARHPSAAGLQLVELPPEGAGAHDLGSVLPDPLGRRAMGGDGGDRAGVPVGRHAAGDLVVGGVRAAGRRDPDLDRRCRQLERPPVEHDRDRLTALAGEQREPL